MSTFRLRCFDANADRISVQSSCNPTWVPERRRHPWSRPTSREVFLARDEVLVIKTRGDNTIELTRLSEDSEGVILVRSSRRAAIALAPNKPVKLEMEDGEALVLRTDKARDPMKPHRTDVTV